MSEDTTTTVPEKKSRKPRSKKETAVVPDPATPVVERTQEQRTLALKRAVHIFYDLQRLRIAVAGRTQRRADGVDILLHSEDLNLSVHG